MYFKGDFVSLKIKVHRGQILKGMGAGTEFREQVKLGHDMTVTTKNDGTTKPKVHECQ